MKLFNIENDKSVVYIQKKDILEILKYSDNGINEKLLNNMNNFRMEDHIRFENKSMINYLKNVEWIKDISSFRFYTIEEILNEIKIVNNLIENNIKLYSKQRSVSLLNEICKMKYIIVQLNDIIQFKNGNTDLNIPIIESNLGVGLCNAIYQAKECLDYNKIIIYRKDNKSINVDDYSEICDINRIIGDISLEKNSSEEIKGDFSINKIFLDNNKKLLIEYKQKYKKENSNIKKGNTILNKIIKLVKKDKK